MANQGWLETEPGARAALGQAFRLAEAGLRRPWLTASCTVLLALLLLGSVFWLRSAYAPVFVVRVAEPGNAPSSLPRIKRQLAEYVRQGVMTSEPLLDVMRKHALYASLMRKNKRAALESFREDIDVDVYQNYFVEQRAPGQAPRSARLLISYKAKDPELALAVTRDLGRLVIEHERDMRREQAAAAAAYAAQARDRLQLALRERVHQALARQSAISTTENPDPELQVELVSTLGSVAAVQQQLELAERRANALGLGAALERRGMGLNFQVVDAGSLPSRAGRVGRALLLLGGCLLVGLPMVALAIGAFAAAKGRT